MANRLHVYFEDKLVGHVFDTSPLSFEYERTWIGETNCPPVGNIPKRDGRIDDASVLAFFDNLLPEGELRSYLSVQKQAGTVFALLRELAGDTAGGFEILPEGKTPLKQSYTRTSWEDIARKLSGKEAAAVDIKVKGARISLAGAQDKALIAIDSDGVLLPDGSSPSTHILKPDIRRLTKVWASAANEAIVMRAARHAGMTVAEVFYEPITSACVVKRFDRIGTPPGRVSRLIQFDLCQLDNSRSDVKYESDGGPGIVRCAELIRHHSSQAAADLKRWLEWLFFNIYLGNNDCHAKNLSVFYAPDKGSVLTPFYDLMNTRLYPGLSPNFAFSIGGEREPGKFARKHVVEMANAVGMRPQYVLGLAEQLAGRIQDALETAISEVEPLLDPGRRVLAARMRDSVRRTTRQSLERMTGVRATARK